MSSINISKQNLVDEAKKQKNNVIEKLNSYDSFLKYTETPEKKEYTSNVQYLTPKESSAEAIKNKAEQKLETYKTLQENKIKDTANTNIMENEEKINKTQNEEENKIEAIKNSIENQKEKANENAISKGLGRSSIRESKLDELDKIGENEIQNLRDETTKKISELKNKGAELERQKDVALANFAIEYAVKLQNEIDELNNEVASYNNKIIEYNNKLAQTEAQNQQNFENNFNKQVQENEERNKQLTKFLKTYGYSYFNTFVKNQKISEVNEFLNSLDKDTALEVLTEDDKFKDILGEETFNQIVEKIKNRVE